MNILTAENRLVLFACTADPDFDTVLRAINEIDDWAMACDKLIKMGVAPLLLEMLETYPGLADGDKSPEEEKAEMADGLKRVPKEALTKLKLDYLFQATQSMLLYDAFSEIAEGLNAKGIKAVALGGLYLAEHLYSKIGIRQFSDIELLFRKEDLEAALEVFETLGFVLEKQAFSDDVSQTHEAAHLQHLIRRGISVKLHTRLHGPSKRPDLPEMELFDRAVPVTINSQAFHVLELHDLFMHLCIRLEKQIHSSTMHLYPCADIGRIIMQHEKELNWETLLSRSNAYRCEKEFISQIWLCKYIFYAPIPKELSRALNGWKIPALLYCIFDKLNDISELILPQQQQN